MQLTHVRLITVLKMTHRLKSEDVFTSIHRSSVTHREFLQGEKQLYGMKSTLYVPKYPCMCVWMSAFTRKFFTCDCIHSHAQKKINSNTHTQTMMCVCFTFSILGCYCFVAVLGAAAHRVEAEEEEEEEEGEVLDRHRCLLALAALRHAKWFQVGTHSLPVFLPDAYCSLTIHPEGNHSLSDDAVALIMPTV